MSEHSVTETQFLDFFVSRIKDLYPDYTYYIYLHPSQLKPGNRKALLKVIDGHSEFWLTSGNAKTVRGILNKRFYDRVLKELKSWSDYQQGKVK